MGKIIFFISGEGFLDEPQYASQKKNKSYNDSDILNAIAEI